MKFKFLKMACLGLILSVNGFANAGLIVAGIGANYSQQAANEIVTTDLGGTINRLSHTDFNALSVAELIASYDVLLFTWATHTDLNADWASVIAPYLSAGGGVIFEDPNNVFSDLGAIVSSSSYASWLTPFITNNAISTTVSGLTDGLPVGTNVEHNHFNFGGGVTGLYGEWGAGRIVIQGQDPDYHAYSTAPDSYGNQYTLLSNEISWVSDSTEVPEPSTLAIFALGMIGLASRRFKKQS
jgi:hypothetical protein